MNILKGDFCIKINNDDRAEYRNLSHKLFMKFDYYSKKQYDCYDSTDRKGVYYYGFKGGQPKVNLIPWEPIMTLETYKYQVNRILKDEEILEDIDSYSII